MFSRPPQRKIAVWYGQASRYKSVDPSPAKSISLITQYDTSMTCRSPIVGMGLCPAKQLRARIYMRRSIKKSGCRELHPPHSLRLY